MHRPAVRSTTLTLFLLGVLSASCGDEGRRDPTPPDASIVVSTDASVRRDAGSAMGSVGGKDGAVTDPAGARRNELLLATSPTHTCALRQAGLYCWGENFAGQLGTGDTTTSDVPVRATQVGTDIVELALATGRSCVRRSSGEVACWGINEQGQLGDGTRTDSLRAVTVRELADARALALDDATTCALRVGGSVSCWGGSPMDSPAQGSPSPVPIAGVEGAVELRAGLLGDYCARGEAGWVRCWKLEEATWTAAVELPALQGARALGMTGENEVCAILEEGSIHCHNRVSGLTIPLDDSQSSVELLAAGSLSACARNTAEEWHCWNVLPPMLETVGSPAIPVTSELSIEQLVLSGFRVCGRLEDDRIGCANANDVAALMSAPTLSVLADLPP
jgi:hypothetical protein